MARCADIPFPHHRVGVIIIIHKLLPPRRLPSDVKIGFSLGNLDGFYYRNLRIRYSFIPIAFPVRFFSLSLV